MVPTASTDTLMQEECGTAFERHKDGLDVVISIPLALGKTEASAQYNPETSQLCPSLSRTDVFGLDPIRHVLIWWADSTAILLGWIPDPKSIEIIIISPSKL